MPRILLDLRFALRNLRRSPLFTLVAVASLALGIGANTAIFTLIDQLMLRLLPVSNPEQLVMIWSTGPHMGSNRGAACLVLPDVPGLPAEGAGLLLRLLPLLHRQLPQLRRPDRARRRELVSGNYFQALGVKPAIGRVFSPEEDDRVYKGHPVRGPEPSVLGHALRRRPVGDRPEDPGQQLPHDDRRRLRARLRRPRSHRARRRSASPSR